MGKTGKMLPSKDRTLENYMAKDDLVTSLRNSFQLHETENSLNSGHGRGEWVTCKIDLRRKSVLTILWREKNQKCPPKPRKKSTNNQGNADQN